MNRIRFEVLWTLLLVSLGLNFLLLMMPNKIGSSGGTGEVEVFQSILSPRQRSKAFRAAEEERIARAIGPTVRLPRAVSIAFLSKLPAGGHRILQSRDSLAYARLKAEWQMMLGATDDEFAAVERAIDEMLDKLAVDIRTKASINVDGDWQTFDFTGNPLELGYRKAFEESLISQKMDARLAEDFGSLVFEFKPLESLRSVSLDFTPPPLGGDSNPLLVWFRYEDGSNSSTRFGNADSDRLVRLFVNLAEVPVPE